MSHGDFMRKPAFCICEIKGAGSTGRCLFFSKLSVIASSYI